MNSHWSEFQLVEIQNFGSPEFNFGDCNSDQWEFILQSRVSLNWLYYVLSLVIISACQNSQFWPAKIHNFGSPKFWIQSYNTLRIPLILRFTLYISFKLYHLYHLPAFTIHTFFILCSAVYSNQNYSGVIPTIPAVF